MIMKNQRPTIAWRIWSPARSRLSAAEPLDRRRLLAERLARAASPLTDSVSSVTADISASAFCVSLLTSRRTLPTR